MEDDPSTRARRVYHMGNLLQKRGEVKEAAKMYRSAVKLDPAHKASHYNLGGYCCIVRGQGFSMNDAIGEVWLRVRRDRVCVPQAYPIFPISS